MKIILSQIINSTPTAAIDAAEQWLQQEATGLTPERGKTPGGLPFVAIEQNIDGIVISTRFLAEAINGSTRLEFQLRMRGQGIMGKIRNIGMLPMTRIVRKASIEQLQEITNRLAATE